MSRFEASLQNLIDFPRHLYSDNNKNPFLRSFGKKRFKTVETYLNEFFVAWSLKAKKILYLINAS